MRTLVLSTEFPPGPGGIGTHAYELARHLNERGWDVDVMAPQDYADDERIAEFNRNQSFGVHRSSSGGGGPWKWVRRWRDAHRLMRARRPEVIVASGMRAVWLAAILRMRFGTPLIAIGHGTEFGVRGRMERLLNRFAFRASQRVVCVSQYTWRQMAEAGIRPHGGEVIHNGADPAVFVSQPSERRQEIRERLGLAGRRAIVTVGQVSERKGQEVVIRALPQVAERVPDVVYLVVGLPTEADRCSAVARDLGVADRVRFLGRIETDDMVDVLNAADLFAMTSRYTSQGDFEGYGIAVIEAALCGLPAVVSGDSGLVEAIEPGVTGLTVPQDDPPATADALSALLADAPRREAMACRARTRARKQTWDSRMREYDRLARDLVTGGGTSRRFAGADEPLRVLQVIDTLELGGAERVLVEVARGLRAEGVEVGVCTTRGLGPLAADLPAEIPLDSLRRRRRFDWGDLRRFGRRLLRERVEVIHAHGRSTFSFVAAARAAGFVDVPLVLHDHYGRIAIDAAVPTWFRLWGRHHVGRYVGVCGEMRGWADRAGLDPAVVDVIPNGIDLDRFEGVEPADLRTEFGLPGEAPIGLMVGNVRPEKGVLQLIRAIAASERAPDARYLMVGRSDDREYRAECDRELRAADLERHVRFVGERTDVPALMRGADFAVVPSISEAGQLVLLEAIAAGLPFVSSRVGEVARRIEALGLETFVPPDDSAALGAGLDRLLGLSVTERTARGLRGRRAAEPHMAASAAIPRWIELYDGLVRGRR